MSSSSKMTKRSSIRYFTVLKSLIKETIKLLEYEKLDNLSETTANLMHLTNEYGEKHNLRSKVVIHLVDDQLQMIKKDTCGIYQIYFHVSLFNPLEKSNILKEKTLNRKTTEKLLNEILSMDRQENEDRIEAFAQENDIKQN